MSDKKFELALFDLGGVAVEVDADHLVHQVSQLVGRSFDEIQQAVYHPEWLLPLEIGRISAKNYYDHLKEKFSLVWSFEQFRDLWNGVLSENTKVIQIMKHLSHQLRLVALTNTNELHLEHIKTKMPSLSFFEHWIASCEVGFRKPEREIYQKALECAGVQAERTIYIDDRPELVRAGSAVGLTAIRFESTEQLIEELQQLGLSVENS